MSIDPNVLKGHYKEAKRLSAKAQERQKRIAQIRISGDEPPRKRKPDDEKG